MKTSKKIMIFGLVMIVILGTSTLATILITTNITNTTEKSSRDKDIFNLNVQIQNLSAQIENLSANLSKFRLEKGDFATYWDAPFGNVSYWIALRFNSDGTWQITRHDTALMRIFVLENGTWDFKENKIIINASNLNYMGKYAGVYDYVYCENLQKILLIKPHNDDNSLYDVPFVQSDTQEIIMI